MPIQMWPLIVVVRECLSSIQMCSFLISVSYKLTNVVFVFEMRMFELTAANIRTTVGQNP